MSRALERLFQVAHARHLDVLLEHPGKRFRLALQTTRARRRETGEWHPRAYAPLPEVKGSLLEEAAGTLLADLERTPPSRGESKA